MIFFIVSLVSIGIYFVLKSQTILLVFKQNKYNQNNQYFKWIFKNPNKVFGGFDLIYLVVFLLGFFVDLKLQESLSIIIGVILVLLFLKKKEKIKKPFVYTNKDIRLLVTYYLMHLIILLIMNMYYDMVIVKYYYLFIGLLVYFNYFSLYIANIINKPIELLINYRKKNIIKK